MSPEASVQKVFTEVGTSGLRRFAGVVNDDPYGKTLSWHEQVRIYSEMVNNEPLVAGGLTAIDAVIRKVNWFVKPYSESAEDHAVADFVDSCMHDMSTTWVDTISEILTMIQYGWAFHEIVYKRRQGPSNTNIDFSATPITVGNDLPNPTTNEPSLYNDGKIGWKYLPLRAQETLFKWLFDENGKVLGMVQQAPPLYQMTPIPMDRAMLFRTRNVKGDPQGRSILRAAYRPYYFKRRIEEIEGVGIERDLAGFPVALVDPEILGPEATDAQKAMLESIKQMVTSVRRDALEGLVFPAAYDEHGNKLYSFELMSAGGSRQFSIHETIQRKSTEIVTTMLTDFLLLGHQSTGSFALAADKRGLFTMSVAMLLDIIAAEFNNNAIVKLLVLNGYDPTKAPKLCHDPVENVDLTQLAQYVTAMTTAGMMFPDEDMMNWVRKAADMPERKPDATKAGTPPFVGGQPSTGQPSAAGVPGAQSQNGTAPLPKPPNSNPTPHGLFKDASGVEWEWNWDAE